MTAGKVALVTGCSSGIGRALVGALRERGCFVYASARRPESIADLQGPEVATLRVDMDDPESLRAAVGAAIEGSGRIDALINNAGYGQMGPVIDLTEEQLRAQFETNVIGQITLIQAVVPHMIAQGSGRIINIGSVSAIMTTPFAGAYCASKAAMHALSDALRMELKPFGIDVITVAPGGVQSKFGDNAEANLRLVEGSRYTPVKAGIEARARASQANAATAESVAKDTVDALFAATAPSYVATGAGGKKYPRLKRWLPDRVLDRKLMAMFGLDKLRAG